MNELDCLERRIISAISQCSPYPFGTCETVYRRCKSYDKTIEILRLSRTLAIDTETAMNKLGI